MGLVFDRRLAARARARRAAKFCVGSGAGGRLERADYAAEGTGDRQAKRCNYEDSGRQDERKNQGVFRKVLTVFARPLLH